MTSAPPQPPPDDARAVNSRERRAERVVALSFVTTIAAGLALLVVYIAGGQTQLEAVLLALCLGGLGLGIVVWSHHLLRVEAVVEERTPITADPQELAEIRGALVDESGISRRKLLVRLLLGAFAALGAALTIPVLSLGPAPGRALHQSAWRPGMRLVGVDGAPVTADQLVVGGLTTVFPEGVDIHAAADAPTLLIRVEPELLELVTERAAWAPGGYVAYSKLCTHAGCPVGLYLTERHVLVCPCHQSVFDVLRGAAPISGPAARPLPQLPIQLQPDGTFIALDDFSEPAGPSFWNVYG
ncbi:MAG: Rieske 2Fe-2S domain-containing protein [Chloroflexota bacterium]|nr:Rieske 2Fe-2S domain-containing protein [Chloroflexota bacterium]